MPKCFECNRPAGHQHHVVPRSLGGTRTVPLCETCHGKVHEIEFLNHRELTRAALQAKKARGERIGGVPWGWKVDQSGKLTIDKREHGIWRLIRYWRDQGYSIREIQEELRAHPNTHSRTGGQLSVKRIHALSIKDPSSLS